MTARAVACVGVLIAVAACNASRKRQGADHVPESWSEVRQTAGHQVHVATHQIACQQCHGDGFAPPPADLCASCHPEVRATIHLDFGLASSVALPGCQDCHGFADRAVRPTACMRCHDRKQGTHSAVGAHSDENCGDCHLPHATPSLVLTPCESCHSEQHTVHAGKRGCRDCHSVHEEATAADAQCASCHAALRGALHVELVPLPTSPRLVPTRTNRPAGDGHRKCTSCHQPHAFGKREVVRCDRCHSDQRPLAAAKHNTCTGCHAPHDAGRPRSCASCHTQRTSHPTVEKRPAASSCATCHPPHGGVDVVTCNSCHATHATHATTGCRDCHNPHAANPLRLTAALCATCHADQSRAAGSGHANCSRCHVEAAHVPSKPAPTCSTCHTPEVTTAPRGHQTCADCHDTHASGKPPTPCATCHAEKAKSTHRTQRCATCHRAHGGKTVAAPPSPPACATCHPSEQRPGLHASKGHQDCRTCHRAHELAPRDDRATCTTNCHQAHARHEPSALHCASCHPFAD